MTEKSPKIVFLFGAGASYGASIGGTQGIIPYPPPLGKDLLEHLSREYPHSWRDYVGRKFRKMLRTNFELGFDKLYKTHPDRHNVVPELMRDMARYFAKFQPNEATCYDVIIQHLLSTDLLVKTSFFTLNYERVLEMCIRRSGINDLYPHKIHGSCDWFPKNPIQIQNSQFHVPDGVDKSALRSGHRVIDDVEEHLKQYSFGSQVVPIMVYYKPIKQAPIIDSKERLDIVQDLWPNQVAKAEKIFVIGVRLPTEPSDSHIWDELYRTKAQIIYVGGKTGTDKDFAGLRNRFEAKSMISLGFEFDKSLPKILEHLTL